MLDSVGFTLSLQALWFVLLVACCPMVRSMSESDKCVGNGWTWKLVLLWSNVLITRFLEHELTKFAEFAPKCGAHGWLVWQIRAGPWMASHFPDVIRLCNKRA
jgi:hypothetical protein